MNSNHHAHLNDADDAVVIEHITVAPTMTTSCDNANLHILEVPRAKTQSHCASTERREHCRGSLSDQCIRMKSERKDCARRGCASWICCQTPPIHSGPPRGFDSRQWGLIHQRGASN
jgi:hypothetical protein